MATTTTRTTPREAPKAAVNQGAVAVIPPPRLLPPAPDVLKKYDIDSEGWRTLAESIFPAAQSAAAVVMALDYCKHRKFDIMKRPVHIVPVWNSQARGGQGGMVETIWPGIAELRTTAMRTGQYAGMDVPTFGPMRKEEFAGRIKKRGQGGDQWEEVKATVEFPEWCQITVYRVLGGNRIPFPGPRVYWLEAYAKINNFCDVPNSMWQKRAIGQLEKCTEAAALRRAFPEELGNEYAVDEVGAFHNHEAKDITDEGAATTATPAEPRRSDFTDKGSAAPHAADTGAAGDEPAVGTKATPSQGASEGGGNSAPAQSEGAPSSDQPSEQQGMVTDVEDLNQQPEEKVEFTKYKSLKEFVNFSDHFLQDGATTAGMARQWEEFYRQDMHHVRQNPKATAPSIQALDDLMTLYNAKVGQERQPGEEG